VGRHHFYVESASSKALEVERERLIDLDDAVPQYRATHRGLVVVPPVGPVVAATVQLACRFGFAALPR